jgi:hypothetical protein
MKSHARLGLIWEMLDCMATGYAQWVSAMDPELLEASPCWELVKTMQRREIRDWPLVWHERGGTFYGTPSKHYPNAPGRMIARKTDPIWRWISRFKTPWPPFDWGRGMRLRSMSIDEGEALGVTVSGESPQIPNVGSINLNPLSPEDSLSSFYDWLDQEPAI